MTHPFRVRLLEPDMPSATELLPFLARIDDARWYTNFGPLVQELERELAVRLFAGAALTTVNNGTSAIELAIQALRLPAGTAVALPAYSFPATLTAVLRNGLRPVFTDIDPGVWQMTPALAGRLLERERIGLFLPVATFGNPVDADAWAALMRQTGIPVVVDAAAAVGSQRIAPGPVFCFSLHATKPFACGEGGLVVSSDPLPVARVRRLSNFGLSEHHVDALGTNAKMSEYHAAAGLAQLARWPGIVERRRALLLRYRAALAGSCTFQQTPSDYIPAVLAVRLGSPAAADACARELAAAGFETRRWYALPLHRIPGLHGEPPAGDDADYPQTGQLIACGLGLPFHTRLADADLLAVATLVRAACGH